MFTTNPQLIALAACSRRSSPSPAPKRPPASVLITKRLAAIATAIALVVRQRFSW
jgi:hypothetical protein